jgi:hypothetical protein
MAKVICPSCGAAGRIPDNFLGRRVKCPKCQAPFTAAAAPAKPAAPPPRPAAGPPSGAARGPVKAAPSSPKAAPPSAVRRRTSPPPPPPEEDVLEEVPDEEVGDEEMADEPASTGGRMAYFRPLGYLRNNPGWIGNAFLAGIAGIIPIVGGIVLLGYLYEVVRRILRKGDATYPSFEFGRFGDYIKVGIWPFLVFLLVGIVFGAASVAVQVGLSMVIHSSAVGGVGALFGLAEALVVLPLSLHAGLSRSLAFGPMFQFMGDFYKRLFKEAILGMLVLGLINWLLATAGILLCCVGLIPALGLMTLADANMFAQLYQLYLDRGGRPVAAR